jgi:hypothetical protein
VLIQSVNAFAGGFFIKDNLIFDTEFESEGVKTTKPNPIARLSTVDKPFARNLPRYLRIGRKQLVGVTPPNSKLINTRALAEEELVRGVGAQALYGQSVSQKISVSNGSRPQNMRNTCRKQ